MGKVFLGLVFFKRGGGGWGNLDWVGGGGGEE